MGKGSVLTKQHRSGVNAYPFTDTATRLSNDVPPVKIPAGMFIDAIAYPPGGGVQQYISSLEIVAGQLTVTISDTAQQLCSGSVDLGSGSNTLPLTDALGRPCGLLLGNADWASFTGVIGPGLHVFDIEATELVASCVVPQPQPWVSGLVVNDTLVSGDVWLVGKDGVVLQPISETNTVAIHIVGDPLFVRRAATTQIGSSHSSATPFVTPRPLQKIHVIDVNSGNTVDLLPDAYGTIFISPGHNQSLDNVFRADQQVGGLKLRALSNVLPNGGA